MPTSRVLLSAACLLFTLTACEESPTGGRQLTLVPNQQMAEIGSRTFAEMLRGQPLVENQRVLDYVGCVTRALVDALPEPQGERLVAVFRDPSPNAFALPGGKIGINLGMLDVARTPDQLAAVIGHEIGHVLADHAPRAPGGSKQAATGLRGSLGWRSRR
jgi:predicted Zn-dependent protease